MRRIDLIGQSFGRLTVISRALNTKDGRVSWNCVCACGKAAIVSTKTLRNGRCRSCGCIRVEESRVRLTKHGQGMASRGERTRTYNSWMNAKMRCTNPNQTGFKYWGGRGIRICERWLNSFESFLEDMGPCGPGLSLDRIDVNGDYEPSNCRWATYVEQAHNKRKTCGDRNGNQR